MNKDQQLLEEAYVNMKSTWDYLFSKVPHIINPDGTIDVDGDVDLKREGLEKLTFKLGNGYQVYRLGLVSGNFNIAGNYLKTLKDAPHTVGKNFSCAGNQLWTLEGGPTIVGGNYSCQSNDLESLSGAPTVINGDFLCSTNRLKTLEGGPTTVEGNFNCTLNPTLKSLEGIPEAKSYNIKPFSEHDIERAQLSKHMSPTAKAAWGVDTFADL